MLNLTNGPNNRMLSIDINITLFYSTNAVRARTGIAADVLKSGKTAGRAALNVNTRALVINNRRQYHLRA